MVKTRLELQKRGRSWTVSGLLPSSPAVDVAPAQPEPSAEPDQKVQQAETTSGFGWKLGFCYFSWVLVGIFSYIFPGAGLCSQPCWEPLEAEADPRCWRKRTQRRQARRLGDQQQRRSYWRCSSHLNLMLDSNIYRKKPSIFMVPVDFPLVDDLCGPVRGYKMMPGWRGYGRQP